jgi:hypothetical protein
MPLCNNCELFDENDYEKKYVCKGHLMSSHGDPYRQNKFWVYPLHVRPFSLGSGDYKAASVQEICSNYKQRGLSEFECLGHDTQGDPNGKKSFHGDPQNDHKFLVTIKPS